MFRITVNQAHQINRSHTYPNFTYKDKHSDYTKNENSPFGPRNTRHGGNKKR